MNTQQKKQLIDHLASFITKDRLKVFQENLKQRTNRISIVLEDIFHSQNASAVLRTADCFGVQNIHIIENSNEYNSHPNISLGSSKWLTQTFYNKNKNNTKECLQKLKNDGFRILATTPCNNAKNISDIDVEERKIALLLGSEQDGLSDIALQIADEKVKIPMFGFTESYNISVAAALCMQILIGKIRASKIILGMTEEEKDEVLLNWLRNSIKESELIEKRYIREVNLFIK